MHPVHLMPFESITNKETFIRHEKTDRWAVPGVKFIKEELVSKRAMARRQHCHTADSRDLYSVIRNFEYSEIVLY